MTEPTGTNHVTTAPISFYTDDSGALFARLLSTESPAALDRSVILSLIEKQGFAHFQIDPSILDALIEKAQSQQEDVMLVASPPSYVALDFEYDPETRKLHAILSESDIEHDISFHTIQHTIESEGWQNYGVKQHLISDLIAKAQKKELGNFVVGEKPVFTHIIFMQDDDSNTLFAHLSSSEEDLHNSVSTLQQMLEDQQFADYYLEPNALEGVLKKAHANERGRYAVGEKRDARLAIEFDDELMTAFMTVHPPCGGRDLDQHLLEVGLANAGVDISCCDNATLEKILNSKHAKKSPFAFGVEPVDGKDTKFEALVQEIEHITPEESKSGKIDLREIINFTQVDVGEKLMQRIPAVPGINGRNVKGQVIPAVDGEEIPFNVDLSGATICPDDDNLLIATERGHPVILADGVRVDKTLIVNNVDMASGNINYDGSLMVKGEVFPGMKIKVTGDICVQGVVTKASLHAKNNINVLCGIIGSDPSKDGEESPPAIIKAGGNITAQYATQSKITAGIDVDIKEYLSHCEVEAKNKILVGQSGGKGKIFGGTCFAQSGIEANSLGTDGSVKTFVSAGTPHHQQKQFENLQSSLNNRKDQAKQLKTLKHKYTLAVKENPQDVEKLSKIKSIRKVLSNLTEEIEKMEATLNKINRFFKEGKKASVIVRKTTFPNVTISINGAEFIIRQNSKGGMFTKIGSDIRWQN
ncbi:hypothetical protein TDB9533_03639 [Thalassocella blandensis]|nr:hypothetical protein TDB9533_03639 [Thalassocella blandensis]